MPFDNPYHYSEPVWIAGQMFRAWSKEHRELLLDFNKTGIISDSYKLELASKIEVIFGHAYQWGSYDQKNGWYDYEKGDLIPPSDPPKKEE